MKKITLSIFVVLLAMAANAQCRIDYSNYHLVLNEGFEEISIDELDNTIPNPRGVWQFHHDEPNWGWGDKKPANPAIPGDYGEYYQKSQVSIVPDPSNPGNNFLQLTAEKIPPTWLPTTVYPLPGGGRWANFKSGMIQLKRNVSAAPPASCPWQFDPSPGTGWGGYIYGMFEIRMKVPKGCAFPAFWLIGPTQFNIYEGKDNPRMYGAMYDDEWTTLPGGGHPGDAVWLKKYHWDDLADDFHTYTGVWTKNEITFFFDGREVATFRNPTTSSLQGWGGWTEANSIIASLQMWHYCSLEETETREMLIDYIKVYKPNSLTLANNYKSSKEYINHHVFEGLSSPERVSTASRSITLMPQNTSQFYYAGKDGLVYEMLQNTSTSWIYGQAPLVPASSLITPDEQFRGDLHYDIASGKIIYVGNNNRIQYYHSNTSGWFHDYIDNNWGTSAYTVAPGSGNLGVADDGTIFYVGVDHKIQYFTLYGVHGWIPYTYGTNDYAYYWGGDILVEKNTTGGGYDIYYKGADQSLQQFWVDGSGVYHHRQIDNGSSFLVSDKNCSMTLGNQDEVFYIGTDDKIHRFYFTGIAPSLWSHELLNHTYGLPSIVYPNGDYARADITYDNDTRKVQYFGNDGRLQYFGYSPSTGWFHDYIDNYWSTTEFTSFDNSTSPYAVSSSLAYHSLSKRTYYVGKFEWLTPGDLYVDTRKHIRYFEYQPCENLNQPRESWHNIHKTTTSNPNSGVSAASNVKLNSTNAQGKNITLLEYEHRNFVYPNPSTSGEFKLYNPGEDGFITVTDIQGRTILSSKISELKGIINLSSYPSGVYILNANIDGVSYRDKLIKK